MRKYEFPLQTALDLRCREEERAQQRLAHARSVVRERRAGLERTRRRHDAILSGLRGSEGAGARVAIGEMEHASRVLADLRRRRAAQRRRLDEAERECEARRAELVEASRARRTLERLSERRLSEHRRQESLREQRELNEAAISRHRAAATSGLAASLARDPDGAA